VLVRAGKDAIEDEVPMMASAIAFSTFLALPATLLLALGLFTLFSEPTLVNELMERFGTVVPEEAVTLVSDSLLQLQQQRSSGLAITIVGLVLAVWTTTGAVTTMMTAINRAYDLEDERGFVGKRATAAILVVALGIAVLLVAGFLVLGPHIQRWIGDALDAERAVSWIWWTAQWPILLAVLGIVFAAVYALATDRGNRHWRVISPGAAVAVVVWLLVSAGFALYASKFGSYNKTWGSLSVAIVTMVWLWLSALAILYGAEVNAETEREVRGETGDVSDTVERTPASPLRRAG
jgi:membrane protein